MIDMRVGKAIWTRQGSTTHLIELVPIIPRGWMITVDEKAACGGIIWNSYGRAEERLNHMKKVLLSLKDKIEVEWVELKSFDVKAIEAPIGALVSSTTTSPIRSSSPAMEEPIIEEREVLKRKKNAKK